MAKDEEQSEDVPGKANAGAAAATLGKSDGRDDEDTDDEGKARGA